MTNELEGDAIEECMESMSSRIGKLRRFPTAHNFEGSGNKILTLLKNNGYSGLGNH